MSETPKTLVYQRIPCYPRSGVTKRETPFGGRELLPPLLPHEGAGRAIVTPLVPLCYPDSGYLVPRAYRGEAPRRGTSTDEPMRPIP